MGLSFRDEKGRICYKVSGSTGKMKMDRTLELGRNLEIGRILENSSHL